MSQWLEQFVESGGAWALGLVMLGENLFPPIPSELVLPLAGFLVSRGQLLFVWAFLAATGGSLTGAVVLYGLGRYGGRPLILRHRRILRVSEEELDRADEWFDRYGGRIVFFARMVPLARSVVSIPAGTSEMSVWRFMLLSAAGTALWNLLLIGAGMLLGDNWRQVTSVAGTYSLVGIVILAVAAVAVVVWWWRRRAKRREA